MKSREKKIFHEVFDIGVYLKLANAALEIVGGLILFFEEPSKINTLILRLTQHELIQDPKDMVANFLRHQAASITIRGELFTALFLLSHGIIKAFLLIALLRRKLWAYPTAITVFLGFIAYQMYQYVLGGNIWLIALSVLDLSVVILTLVEYNSIKKENKK